MTLKVKKDGAWKEASSLKVKINGEWKDVSTLYSKKDGAWVTVYSSGALIEFADYPFPIPVAKGWKYSSDRVNWTTVSVDGEINTSGTFTGFIKANSITLSDYSTETTPGESGLRMDGEALSVGRTKSTAFTNNLRGYVCGGVSDTNMGTKHSVVDIYDSSGTRTTGTSLSLSRFDSTSFVNSNKGYVCGGYEDSLDSSVVDVYDSSGNRTTGTSLSVIRSNMTSFVNGGKGYVCGGRTGQSTGSTDYSSRVDVYDSSGTRTTGSSLSVARYHMTSFVNGDKGYVCGGIYKSGNFGFSNSRVDIYDLNGTRTTGSSLSVARYGQTSFVNGNNGYICGGVKKLSATSSSYESTVDVYDSSGNISTGSPLRVARAYLTSFTNNSKGYVCGGDGSNAVDVYDSSGTRTTGTSLSSSRNYPTSFVNAEKGYVCGGSIGNSTFRSTVDIYYDIPESYSTKLPITEGSTYTLNGESGTAQASKVMEFDSKVSGTIKYKAGDMSPSVRITVVDESGNVVEGATVSIEKMSNNWDISNINVTITAVSS